MKQSALLLKILGRSKLFPVIPFFLSFFVTSCNETALGNWNFFSSKKDPSPRFNIYTSQDQKKPLFVASVDTKICEKNKEEIENQVWHIPITTIFGEFEASITAANNVALSEPLNVKVDNSVFSINNTDRIPASITKAICKNTPKDQITNVYLKEKKLDTTLKSWLQSLAPQCNYTILKNNKGWQCDLKTNSIQYSSKQLIRFKKRILRKWSRHPYLLTRRLGLTKQLISSAEYPSIQKTNTFCKVLENATEQEKPVVLRSKRLTKALCQNENRENQNKIAQLAINLATKEMQFFQKLVEKTSRLGLLQFKVPKVESPSKDLWISLQPQKDVNRNLLAFTETLNKTKTSIPNKPYNTPCWHPAFNKQPQLLETAAIMRIIDKTRTYNCSTAFKANMSKIKEYLSLSITGETEFILTNGNSKILRLPKGTYKYIARGTPVDKRAWTPTDADPQTSGLIEWTARRPRPRIKKW